jgi:hypothetical protein
MDKIVDNIVLPKGLKVDDNCGTGVFTPSCTISTTQVKDIINKAKTRGEIVGKNKFTQPIKPR